MGLKLFGAGGIDQKSNNLLRADIDLIDSRNMMINTNNEYVKRPGTDEDTSFTDDDYSDMIFIKSMNQYFHRFGGDYVVYENGARRVVPSFFEPALNPNSKISSAEYLNSLIFTHESPMATAKYDHGSIYRAGVPVASLTAVQSGAANVGFVSYFYEFCDGVGNTIYGPLGILPRTNNDLAISIETIINNAADSIGFYSGFITVPVGAQFLRGHGTLSDRTLNYDSISSSIVPGLKIPVRTSSGGIGGTITLKDELSAPPSIFTLGPEQVMFLEVESVDTGAKEIVFTQNSFNSKSVEIIAVLVMNVSCNWTLRVFNSTSETTGYSQNFYDNYVVSQFLTNQSISYPSFSDQEILMSDIYDITTSKLRPPKCKYIYTYGYQIACGSALSFWDFKNKETLYNNNDLVMYSDLSTGDLGENFSESNRQLIGNTYDGQITGLGRVKDSLIVFKDKMVFAMDGVLIPGQYTLRKIETNEIGCTSFKSILSVENALMFQGQDGIYITDGYKAEKATTNLDPFFGTINNELTRSVMNNSLDQYLFWTNQGIVVFDFHHKKWFVWDSIDASAGITVDNDLSIRFFGSTIATKFQTDLNDYGNEIDAYIRSSWFTGGEPGLLKKATFLRLYSFKNAGQKVSLKYFLDWSESKVKGPFEIDMSDVDIKTIKRNLDVIQNQSFSFEFRNDVIDEDLNISGYEINAGIVQERDKNVK